MSNKDILSFVLAFAGLACQAHGAAITIPPGLNPGDTYRILFVTSTERDATSSNIADYNTFVTDAANLDPNLALLTTTWRALASTLTVNALTNAGLSTSDTTTRFYNTMGELIAIGVTVPNTGLYAGLTTSHPNLILNESGTFIDSFVWTGTLKDSSTHPVWHLGQTASSRSRLGQSNSFIWEWSDANSDFSVSAYPFYAISDNLTVPGAEVPEPGTIARTGLGAAAMLLVQRFRKARN